MKFRTFVALQITCALAILIVMPSCVANRNSVDGSIDRFMAPALQEVDYPHLSNQCLEDTSEVVTAEPPTISNYQDLAAWEMSLEEAIRLALTNSKVLQKLGGRVVTGPQAVTTVYDQAILESDPRLSVEAALSAFDAQFNSSYFASQSPQASFNFGGGVSPFFTSESYIYNAELSKQTASGTSFALRNQSQFIDSDFAFAANTFNTLLQAEIRQPLLRGFGTDVNRIAGPNSIAGNYGGVLIARINSDVSLADFEAAIRELVRDVERNYWELYYAYRNLKTRKEGRDSARNVWENRKARLDGGLGRPDDEAQARQQYFNFQIQVENALTGQVQGALGVFGAERELRRLIGADTADGRLIRPTSKPTIAKVAYDWSASQESALLRRVELRRQKFVVRQRELELLAAKDLNKWQFDFVGQYGFRGIEPQESGGLAGTFATEGYSEDYRLGFELRGPIGNRANHLSVKNAEHRLIRESEVLREQQRQIVHDLNAAYTEVDRAFASIKSNYNNFVAVMNELDPKKKRADAGEDEIFFLLDAQQRVATAESSLHRAVTDYNIALLNFNYNAGNLLDRYQIQMHEGGWTEDAIKGAAVANRRFCWNPHAYHWSEEHAISEGAYPQELIDETPMQIESPQEMSTPQIESANPTNDPEQAILTDPNSVILQRPAQIVTELDQPALKTKKLRIDSKPISNKRNDSLYSEF